jgi:hypothetical protein
MRVRVFPDTRGRNAAHSPSYAHSHWYALACPGVLRENGEYRDFVLSRFRGTPELMNDVTEHTRLLDPGWTTPATVILEADPSLKVGQCTIIEANYGMEDGQLVIETRGALIQYVLHRYQIDTTKMHMKPKAQQIVVANMEELGPWLY